MNNVNTVLKEPHMKLISMALFISLIGVEAFATNPVVVKKSVLCSSPQVVFETLSGPGYKEEPIWSGNNNEDRYVLTVNKKTKTWSMVQFNKNIACILSTGENHMPVQARPNS